MAENPRVDELRRRVQQDPASIAFAQLAEECRRSGELEEAVRVCREGLVHHPTYVSAHVTLGRALMALGRAEEARIEFEQVLRTAPDNLLALRCLDELGPSSRSTDSESIAGTDERSTGEPPAPSDVDAPELRAAEGPLIAEPVVPPSDTVLAELERLLAAIRSDRPAPGSGES